MVCIDYYDQEEGAWHDKYLFSDWSTPAAYGKDAPEWVPYTTESLAAPVITGFHMTNEDFNGYPVVAYTLTVPKEVDQAATDVRPRGGYLDIETFARIKGMEEWKQVSGNSDVRAGEMRIKLSGLVSESRPETLKLNRFTEVEVMCRYHCKQYYTWNGDFAGEFRTDYSEIITFDTVELVHEPTGISVRGVFPEGYVLKAEERNLSKQTSVAPENLKKVYALWLETEDGEKVEIPENAALQVKIPYDDEMIRVSYFDEAENETRMKTVYEEGKYIFETNHLGTYALIMRKRGSGDVNGDGSVDIADALMISRYDASLTELTAEQITKGDVSGDDLVDIADALMVSRFDAGLIENFD